LSVASRRTANDFALHY